MVDVVGQTNPWYLVPSSNPTCFCDTLYALYPTRQGHTWSRRWKTTGASLSMRFRLSSSSCPSPGWCAAIPFSPLLCHPPRASPARAFVCSPIFVSSPLACTSALNECGRHQREERQRRRRCRRRGTYGIVSWCRLLRWWQWFVWAVV